MKTKEVKFEENQGKKLSSWANHLFVIAINKYRNCPELFNCIQDAEAFMSLLVEGFRFKKENISQLFNEQASQANIINAFRQYASQLSEKDNLIVYYSGHGIYDKVLDEGYWIPVDAQLGNNGDYISNSEVIKFLKAIDTHHTFLIVDSCFSGTLARFKDLGVARVEQYPSRWLLTSGRNEVVLDGKPGGHSPFAAGILEYLRLHREDRALVSDLVQYVKTAVAHNQEQIPFGGPLYGVGDKGGEFIFHSKEDSAILPLPGTSKVVVQKKEEKGQKVKSTSGWDNIKAWGKATLSRFYWALLLILGIVIGLVLWNNFHDSSIVSGPETLKSRVKNDLFGYVDGKGNEVIPFIYLDAGKFSEGLALAKSSEGYGYINTKGDPIIEFQYDNAREFSKGLAPVQKDGKYGYINRNGEVAIDFRFQDAHPFSYDNQASVSLDGTTYFYIDLKGNRVN